MKLLRFFVELFGVCWHSWKVTVVGKVMRVKQCVKCKKIMIEYF